MTQLSRPAAGPSALAFIPHVPHRRRADGWSSYFQRLFIRELARHGSASAAARACGRSAQSAYRLRERPGAEGFAAAWARAVRIGTARTRQRLADRYGDGEEVPVFYRGRQVGTRRVFRDRVLVSLIGSLAQRGGGDAASRGRQLTELEAWHARLQRWEARLIGRERALAAGGAPEAGVDPKSTETPGVGLAAGKDATEPPSRSGPAGLIHALAAEVLGGATPAEGRPDEDGPDDDGPNEDRPECGPDADAAPPTACGSSQGAEPANTSHLYQPKEVFLAENRDFPENHATAQDMVAAVLGGASLCAGSKAGLGLSKQAPGCAAPPASPKQAP